MKYIDFANLQLTGTALACAVLLNSTAANVQSQDVSPQLEPLKQYLGNWDSEFEVISDKPADPSGKIKGKVTGKWSVGGRFLEQTGTYQLVPTSKPLVIKTLMGYNKSTRRFDYYYFYSSGEIFDGDTTWNADEKILTTIGADKRGKKKFEITADFSKPGEERWLMVLKDENGVKLRVKGKNTLKKKNKEVK